MPEERTSWENWLAEFVREVYPLFAKYDIPLADAMTIFEQNRTINEIVSLPRIDDDEGEEWKRG